MKILFLIGNGFDINENHENWSELELGKFTQNVGSPERENFSACHFLGGGCDYVKMNENLWLDQTSFNLFDMIKEKVGIDSRYCLYP